MKKFLFTILGTMLITQVVHSATIEIGDLSPQIQKTRTTVQKDTNSFNVPDVLAPKDAKRPQESMTVTTNKQIFTPVKREVVKTEPLRKDYEEPKKVYPTKTVETKTQTVKTQAVKPQTTQTVTRTTTPAKKETRSGHEWVCKRIKSNKKRRAIHIPNSRRCSY